tara:strand:+ start:18 stop:689 length:672 start_codon:yes stop_codon:yes gene_type:complete
MSSFQDTISKYPSYVPPEAIEEWDPIKVKTNLEQGVPLFSFLDQTLDQSANIFPIYDSAYFQSQEYKEWCVKNDEMLKKIEEKQKTAEISEEQQINNDINEIIDKLYESGEFERNEGTLHAALSYNKYWNAGSNIVYFFTNNDIDRIWIGNSSSDLRSHSIFKDRKRNMIYEVHYAYGRWDIFPLTSILGYLEAYKPELAKNEQWIKLNEKLPYYDMVPLDSE